MKRSTLIIAILTGFIFLQPAKAQVQVNIGVQPLWGPVDYDYVEYYYFPAYEVYYYVPSRRFVYLDGPSWRFAPALPSRFGRIDYYSTYKVVVNEPKAYLRFNDHKVKYVGYKGGGPKQVVIRDSRDSKYYVVKGHPNYSGAKKSVASPSKGSNSSGKVKSAPTPSKGSQPSGKMKSSPAPKGNSGGGGKHGGGNQGGGGGKGKGGGKH
ncbi:MAG: hypothetical protein V4615_06545 [Bacteroidota bacterium]